MEVLFHIFDYNNWTANANLFGKIGQFVVVQETRPVLSNYTMPGTGFGKPALHLFAVTRLSRRLCQNWSSD